MNHVSNYVVQFSGGRTSAYMVWLFEEKRKRENFNVEYIFCDTAAEHPKTYAFVRNVAKHFNIEITCLRTKIDFINGVGGPASYEVIPLSRCTNDLKPFHDLLKKCGTPTAAAAECTNILKSIPSDKYCNEKYGKRNYVKWLGIRVDEPNRIKIVEAQTDMSSDLLPKKRNSVPLRYLGEISDFTKSDVINFWSEMPFDLDIPEELGNCVFCIKKGNNKVALAAKKEPVLAAEFIKLVNLPDVRIKESKVSRGMTNEQMYRGRMSLLDVIEAHAGISIEDLENSIRRGRRFNTDSCSESCEAMTYETNLELFE